MDDDALFAAFARLHQDLPHEAPGSEAATRRALALCAPRADARIADMGCGPGPSSAALLKALPGAHVTGMDLHRPYVEAAAARIEAQGDGRRFTGVVGDIGEPPLTGPFDLIWSEGAIYNVGVTEALRAWAPLLADGGAAAFTDAVWLTEDPHPRARAVFADYPQMDHLPVVRERVLAAGYKPFHAFELTAAEWDNYYLPLAARCDALEPELSASPEGREVIALTREEIATRGEAGRDYGYVFIIARKDA